MQPIEQSYHNSPVNENTIAPQTEVDLALLGSNTKFASLLDNNSVIVRYYLQAEARRLLPTHRVRSCHRFLVPDKTFVNVMYSPLVGKAHYKNLMHCDSVWVCAVCASKITERRREELTAALAPTKYIPILITYTLRHNAGDSLKSLLEAALSAFRHLKSGVGWQAFRHAYGWVGSIRSLETTHGDNGWHPHIHELALLDITLIEDDFEKFVIFLKQRWNMTLLRHKRDASWDYGVDVRTAREDIAEYVAKFGHQPVVTGWTIEAELTKAPVKRGKGEHGRSPQQLLADSAMGDEIASRLYIEYASCIKGKKQLVWSKGLRELLGLGRYEPTDSDLAGESTAEAFILAQLTKAQWDVILGNDARGELLKIANAGDWVKLRDWLVDFGIVLDF